MKKILTTLIITTILFSCKKETDQLAIIPLGDYAPLTIGKYITYGLDSLVYTNFGTIPIHRLYEVKYLTADTLTDNIGRKAFRIVRYIRTIPAGVFAPDNTFMAINTGNTYEFVENNLRYFKLTLPIAEGNTWKGNSAIDVTSNNDNQYLADWDYTYEKVGQSKQIGSFNLANTITINQRDVSTNLPVTAATNIASKTFSQDVYAAGIGLVYRNFLNWEYQPGQNYKGYGITLQMIDHN
ncbi:MAG: hypothetical protein ABL929_03880 [Ferruginibacter sp.]|nr:hypothetical protein [Ferruginibacter sp.]